MEYVIGIAVIVGLIILFANRNKKKTPTVVRPVREVDDTPRTVRSSEPTPVQEVVEPEIAEVVTEPVKAPKAKRKRTVKKPAKTTDNTKAIKKDVKATKAKGGGNSNKQKN